MDVDDLIDEMLDRAPCRAPRRRGSGDHGCSRAAGPDTGPLHSDKPVRAINGREGCCSGHVYRDCLVETCFDKPWLVRVLGWGSDQPALWADLRTRSVGTAPPPASFAPIGD